MSRRGDCIHKRKDNRWEGRYIKEYIDGKAKYMSVYVKTYSETKHKLTEAIKQNQRLNQKSQITNELFCESYYDWLNHISNNIKPKTYQQYLFCANKYIIPHIGDYCSKDIDVYKINELLEYLSKYGRAEKQGGLSGSTLNIIRYIILSTLNYLVEQQKITRITGRVSCYKTSAKKEPEIFSLQEFSRLENILYKDMDNWKLGVILCMYTGLRIGEVCALTWQDINIPERYLSVSKSIQRLTNREKSSNLKTSLCMCKPKTEYSIRNIPLAHNLTFLLQIYSAKAESEHFIITNSSKIPDPRTVENKFKTYLKKANVPQKNFHVLRHTFASRCIESGMDVKSLSSILGHSNIMITMNRYVHPSTTYKLEQLDKMLDYYGQINGQDSPVLFEIS